MQTEVIGIKHFADDNFIIRLKRPKELNFKAGQFLMLYAKDKCKPFSIASPPSEKSIDFLIKKHDDGAVTPYLIKLKKGDKVKITGPYGSFGIKKNAAEIVFIAVGCGVAPFRAMAGDYLEKNPEKKVTFVFGFRNDFFFENEFKELGKKHKNFKLYAFCSKPKPIWKGLTGHVTEHLKNIIINPEQKIVYLCGMSEMIEETKKILVEQIGFKDNQIHIEEWRSATPQINESKKLKFGWFSFTCSEDSTIVFTELLNDHFDEWSKLINFQNVRILKSKNKLEGLDVAFVEGAIASKKDENKLKEIRKNCKKLIAVGSCAITGMPASQRNNFSPKLKKEIEFLIKKFHQSKKVKKLDEIVKVDDKVPGCPMSEEAFLNVLEKYLQEFGVGK